MAPEALGIGVAVWDKYMTNTDVPQLIRDAGFSVIRYPGGSYADIYHWRTHSATKGLPFKATIRPGVDFDHFMGMARKAAATPLITVNYGTNEAGTGGAEPREAAEWVRYANRVKHYGVKYWEIGNEVYGNGFYNGRGWEADFHAPDTHKEKDRLRNPKLGPVEYGRNMLAFIKAMKAEDPSVKIGAVLCAPGNWPDAVAPDWNSNVLKICGDKVDFVVVHWYGEGKSPAQSLATERKVPELLSKLRAQVDQYCGAHAKNVQLWMTEGDCSGYNTRHVGALFAADHFLTWWENGATHVDWWDLHNGAVKAFDGALDDQGILSNASSVGALNEPQLNTPFPPYYGVRLTSLVASPGDSFIAAESSAPLLRVHAVRKKNGGLGLMLINQDPRNAATVTITANGMTLAGPAARYDYGEKTGGIAKSTMPVSGSTLTLTIPPSTATAVASPGH